MDQSPPAIVPAKPDEVPEDLKCAICFGLPLNPAMTRCEHVFCKHCLHAALETSPTCPMCRADCDSTESAFDLPRGGFAYRLWSNVPVQCTASKCLWTGGLADAEMHLTICRQRQREGPLSHLFAQLRLLEKEKGELKRKLDNANEQRRAVQTENIIRCAQMSTLKERVSQLDRQNSELRVACDNACQTVVALGEKVSTLEKQNHALKRRAFFMQEQNASLRVRVESNTIAISHEPHSLPPKTVL